MKSIAVWMVFVCISTCVMASQGSETKQEEIAAQAVEAFLVQDSELGSQRNHDPETMPLNQAIDRYVQALKAIELPVPPDFEQAFAKHIEAWEAMSGYCRGFEKERGELHAIFDRLALESNPSHARFNELKEGVWETWRQVEAVARRYKE